MAQNFDVQQKFNHKSKSMLLSVGNIVNPDQQMNYLQCTMIMAVKKRE